MPSIYDFCERTADRLEKRIRWDTLWRSRRMGLIAGPFRFVEFWGFAGGWTECRRSVRARLGLAWTMYLARYWHDWFPTP